MGVQSQALSLYFSANPRGLSDGVSQCSLVGRATQRCINNFTSQHPKFLVRIKESKPRRTFSERQVRTLLPDFPESGGFEFMKQGTTTSITKAECKPIDMSQPTTPSRLRAPSKLKDSPKPSRAKSLSPDVNDNSKPRRSLALTKPKSGEQPLGSQKGREHEEPKVVGRPVHLPAVEQFSRPRRQRPVDPSCKKLDDDPYRKKELEDKLEKSETLIENLQSEVVYLKAELDKALGFNVELQSQNKKLTHDLAAAEAKIAALSTRDLRESIGEYKSPKFKDIQKLIANKLDSSVAKKEATIEANNVKTPSLYLPPPPPPLPIDTIPKVANVERKATPSPSPPPPPPPPRLSARATTNQKAPALVQFYHSLTKQEGKKDSSGSGNRHKAAATSAHSSIVGEIQNRSAHLLAIKSDIETKGDFINGLIEKVLAAAYMDIEDILKFVDWLDGELSSLADERAVLKHFKWPERKADAMREAAVEYRELRLLEKEISSFKDDTSIPCTAALKKITSLLDKSERSIQRLIKLRNSVLCSYQECRIPTDWMLDSGIVSKIKQASMSLAKMYMKRVTLELESIQNSDREYSQESLLLQGVKFAYRAHQFAGGLDSETLCAFEDIRQRFPGQLGGSRELLAGIPSS
ncbi:hypothetical protein FNV43_RR01082 [Rhamnella rubrinervis]|uniref:Protein CHUP1, chloroplastic n=1 Tax=Rhamnella rubrinervis TaxID=2594499 RepID=A0A8K0HP64_9ROSA|nr:hypothetical protein FNV43_RR01082 [Rhamnella rubrinervis]